MEAVQRIEHPTFETVWAALQEVAKLHKESAERFDREMKEVSERQKETERQMKENTERFDQQIAEWKKEIAEKQAEQQRESTEQQRQVAERQKEAGERQKESIEREIERQRKIAERRKKAAEDHGNTEKIFSYGYNKPLLEIPEYMRDFDIPYKFEELGFKVDSAQEFSVYDTNGKLIFSVGFMLQNDSEAILVKMGFFLTVEEVDEHIKLIEDMYAYSRSDPHTYFDKHSFFGAVAQAIMEPDVKDYALKQGLYVIEVFDREICITTPQGGAKKF